MLIPESGRVSSVQRPSSALGMARGNGPGSRRGKMLQSVLHQPVQLAVHRSRDRDARAPCRYGAFCGTGCEKILSLRFVSKDSLYVCSVNYVVV